MTGLPGAEIVAPGLEDLKAGRTTVAAAAVELAATRLRTAGVDVPSGIPPQDRPAAHRLYGLLVEELGDGAYSRYNAILGRMVSFSQSAERAIRG